MSKSKKSYHHGDLRNSLLEAAEAFVEQNGLAGVSLREVAKQAGVSHTAPYRHFKDKTDLLIALAQIGFGRLADAMEDCVREFPDAPTKQLKQAAIAYIQLVLEHPQVNQLMFGGVVDHSRITESLQQEADRAFQGLLRIIDNGAQQQLYRDKPTEELAVFVWSLAHGFSVLISSGQILPKPHDQAALQHLIDSLTSMVLNGIARPGS